MKALASPPVILFIVVAVARYIVPSVSFFPVYRLKTVSVWHVRNRSNRFDGGRLFTVNNGEQPTSSEVYITYTTRVLGGVEKHAGVYVKY